VYASRVVSIANALLASMAIEVDAYVGVTKMVLVPVEGNSTSPEKIVVSPSRITTVTEDEELIVSVVVGVVVDILESVVGVVVPVEAGSVACELEAVLVVTLDVAVVVLALEVIST